MQLTSFCQTLTLREWYEIRLFQNFCGGLHRRLVRGAKSRRRHQFPSFRSCNATDNAAYRARGNATIPAYVFAILLEGNTTSPMDYHLMQRIANDPAADQFNATPKYGACAACATAGQYTGMFVDSPNQSTLNSAFLQVSSQILRLNQ